MRCHQFEQRSSRETGRRSDAGLLRWAPCSQSARLDRFPQGTCCPTHYQHILSDRQAGSIVVVLLFESELCNLVLAISSRRHNLLTSSSFSSSHSKRVPRSRLISLSYFPHSLLSYSYSYLLVLNLHLKKKKLTLNRKFFQFWRLSAGRYVSAVRIPYPYLNIGIGCCKQQRDSLCI